MFLHRIVHQILSSVDNYQRGILSLQTLKNWKRTISPSPTSTFQVIFPGIQVRLFQVLHNSVWVKEKN